MTALTKAARTGGVTGLALGAALLFAGPASAHVTVSPGEGVAGEYTVATVSVPHGCDGSATTKVTIQVPKQLDSITPTINPGWTVTKKLEKLKKPITAENGDKVTTRVAQVIYTARTPLPDGYRDAFELSFQVPDKAGTTMRFPAIQKCVKGQTAWVEVAQEGQPEPAHPAPTFKIVAADSATSTTSADDGGSNGWGITGAVAGILGLIAGGAALARTRRQG